MIKVGIIGATGYAGNELVRLLLGHKDAEIVWLGSRSYIDQNYSDVYRNMFKLVDAQVKSLLQGKKILVKGLKGKKGSYDAYLIPESIEEFSYTKDGKEIKGFQYKFKMEFSQKAGKQG